MGEQSSWTAMASEEDRMSHGTVGQSIDKWKKKYIWDSSSEKLSQSRSGCVTNAAYGCSVSFLDNRMVTDYGN